MYNDISRYLLKIVTTSITLTSQLQFEQIKITRRRQN